MQAPYAHMQAPYAHTQATCISSVNRALGWLAEVNLRVMKAVFFFVLVSEWTTFTLSVYIKEMGGFVRSMMQIVCEI